MAVQVELSWDLVEEILAWLRVHSLVRFKCVSKQWHLLLSNPVFIRRHMKTRSSTQPHRIFFFRTNYKCIEFSSGTPHNNGDYGILFQPLETKFQDQSWEECYNVVDHCNGLLCVSFHCKKSSSVIVWNPSTKEQKRFPAPDQLYAEKRKQCYGFGYNSASDDYKVVLVTTSENKPAMIHSLGLKMDYWETAENDIHYWFDCSTTYTKHVNGYIYWVIRKSGVGDNGPHNIACFDLGRNRMREEETLSEKLSSGQRFVSLHLLGDSLCMMETDDYINFNAWIMKENEVTGKKCCIKFFIVSTSYNVFTPSRSPVDEDWILPICFTVNGRVLMVAYEREDYVLYDPNDESFKNVDSFSSRGRFNYWYPLSPHVESLVSPGKQDKCRKRKAW